MKIKISIEVSEVNLDDGVQGFRHELDFDLDNDDYKHGTHACADAITKLILCIQPVRSSFFVSKIVYGVLAVEEVCDFAREVEEGLMDAANRTVEFWNELDGEVDEMLVQDKA